MLEEGRSSEGATARAAKGFVTNVIQIPEWMYMYGLILTVCSESRQWSHTLQLTHTPFGMLVGGHRILEVGEKSHAYGRGLQAQDVRNAAPDNIKS